VPEIEQPKPIALDYSREPSQARSSWPLGLYTLALLWALVTMRFYTATTTSYREESNAELRAQLALLTCATLRLVWARRRGEDGRGWVFYVVLLLCAPILWAMIAHPLATLGRTFWGRPLIP
jgi:hypothetical protein